MSKFKKGDEVKVIRGGREGQTLYVAQNDSSCPYIATTYEDAMSGEWDGAEDEDDLELLQKQSLSIRNNNVPEVHITKNTMTLIATVRNLFRSEPEKSFIKTGIMNDNATFTPEGRDLFIDYLLQQNKEAFNKDLVQPLLEAQKKEEEK